MTVHTKVATCQASLAADGVATSNPSSSEYHSCLVWSVLGCLLHLSRMKSPIAPRMVDLQRRGRTGWWGWW